MGCFQGPMIERRMEHYASRTFLVLGAAAAALLTAHVAVMLWRGTS